MLINSGARNLNVAAVEFGIFVQSLSIYSQRTLSSTVGDSNRAGNANEVFMVFPLNNGLHQTRY